MTRKLVTIRLVKDVIRPGAPYAKKGSTLSATINPGGTAKVEGWGRYQVLRRDEFELVIPEEHFEKLLRGEKG